MDCVSIGDSIDINRIANIKTITILGESFRKYKSNFNDNRRKCDDTDKLDSEIISKAIRYAKMVCKYSKNKSILINHHGDNLKLEKEIMNNIVYSL